MHPTLKLALAFVALTFVACGPANDSSTTNVPATSSGQNVANASGSSIEIPEFQYPEELNVQLTRELRIFDSYGRTERFAENFSSDGAGQIALTATNYAGFGVSTWSAPSTQLLASYYDRQSYLVKYRDLHLGSSVSLHRNFRWTEQPGIVHVAGIDCRRINAKSVEGLGDFEFVATVDTGLLLGWTSFDPQGNPLMQLETTAINLAPNHSSVLWAVPAVAEHPYVDRIDEPKLGFPPGSPQYLPPGFYLLEKRLLLANGVMAGFGNIHAAMYTDGIHLLFVAQQRIVAAPAMNYLAGASLVKEASTGGIRVAEGDLPGRRIYVVSQLPTEELETVFGSMF